jgi:hypothetical protein
MGLFYFTDLALMCFLTVMLMHLLLCRALVDVTYFTEKNSERA